MVQTSAHPMCQNQILAMKATKAMKTLKALKAMRMTEAEWAEWAKWWDNCGRKKLLLRGGVRHLTYEGWGHS